MQLKSYWNKVADNKEFTTPFQINEFNHFVNKNALILDVGCGYGRTLSELYDNGYKKLLGIDFSERMISRGKKLYPYLDLQIKTGEEIDFEDNSVDAVNLIAVLTCIPDDKKQTDLLNEIDRVLKPKGILYVNDFLLNQDERNLIRYSEFEKKYSYGIFELPEGAILRHHNKKYIEELLSRFSQLRMEEIVFTTMNGNKSNGFYYIGRKK